MSEVVHGVVGLAGLLGIAWLLSERRRAVPWRLVGAGVLLALLLAVAMLRRQSKTKWRKVMERWSTLAIVSAWYWCVLGKYPSALTYQLMAQVATGCIVW